MPGPEAILFADDGTIPNSPLPLVLMPRAAEPDAAAIERLFAAHGWSGAWRDGVYPFHHFHSIAHEVLGIARGAVRVRFGGPGGESRDLRAGDVVVIPAGVGHCNEGASGDLLVVGAYPGGGHWDVRRGDPAEHDLVRQNIAAVPLPRTDPVHGATGPLLQLWRP